MESANSQFRVWNRATLIALAVYVALAALLHQAYQYRLNPDGVSYLMVAQRYAAGDYHNAITGYWAPLLSWLTALAIKAGAVPLTAIKLWEFAFGAAMIVGASLLLSRFEVTGRPRALALTLCVVNALCFSLTLVTPDIVTVALLLLYYAAVWDPRYTERRWIGVICGALGGLAYFAKNYNFYFIAIHFAAMNLWYFRAAASPEARKAVLRHTVAGFAVFLALSSVWIGIMWGKYGTISVGSAGTFNHRLMGPDSQGGPEDNQGFVPPPDATAIAMWDDPSLYLDRMIPWNPLGSWRNAKHFVTMFGKHTIEAVSSTALAFAILLLVYARWRNGPLPHRIYWGFATAALYGIGYCPFMVECRYFWSSKILGIVMCAALLSSLGRDRKAHGLKRRRWPYFIYGFVFVLGPYFTQYPPHYMTTCFELLGSFGAGKDYYKFAQHLKNDCHVSGNIASSRDMWTRGLQVCYFLGAHFYGQAAKNTSDADLEREWAKYDIDYYFVWLLPGEHERPSDAFLSRFPEVSGGGHPYLKVYACKKPLS